VGRADLGARLLVCRDPAEAGALAARLEEVNTERRAIEAGVRDAALAQAEMRGPVAWAAGEGWHPGVVGIVAGRVARRTGRPAVVLGLADGVAKGSGRSVPGIDLGRAVQRLVREGLLLTGGGHEMAAGLSARQEALPAAMERLGELLARQGAGGGGPRELAVDGMLMPGAVTVELCEALEAAGPYGEGSPAPRLVCPSVCVQDVRRIGGNHLKLRYSDGIGPSREAVAFGAHDGPLGPAIEAHGGARLHLAGRIELNHWRGRSTVQLRLSDAAFV
jgi:single-stranded-DNA-specific exonuclease